MNEPNEWHTINQTAEIVNIPSETVRRYVRQYSDYLQSKKGARRSYLIHAQSIDTVKKIRYLLDQGYQHEQVDQILQQTETLTVQTDNDAMNEYMKSLPQLSRDTEKNTRDLLEQTERQNRKMEALQEDIKALHRKIDERDKVILDILETKEETAAEKEPGFFRRLFKK